MTIPSPKQILQIHGLAPKRSFGQNFLSDTNLCAKIAALTKASSPSYVLEIGAGLGALTDGLLAAGHNVIAVERDRDLVPVLQELFAGELESGALHVLEADAKTLDWEEVFAERKLSLTPAVKSSFVLAGNLPYQITGALLEKAVHLGRQIERAVFLVQKEVADRLAASPGSKIYGALSVFTQAQFKVERAFVIKAGAFYPQPRIDSAVVVLQPHEMPWADENADFRKVVKGAFASRRKTLRNSWKALCPAGVLATLAQHCDIDLDKRGETLHVSEFAKMTREFSAWRESQGIE